MIPLNLRALIPSTLLVLLITSLLSSCKQTTDVFEKNIAIPKHAWSKDFKPEISFTVQDTTHRYHVFVVIRHTDAYRYRNIWVNVQVQNPTGITKTYPLDLQLAVDDKGWLGTGMDDIFEHRIQITPKDQPESLSAGTYRFTLENLMREDPLEYVMNAGIRIEKAK